jgi:2-octaprenyl-6-methoxyphenol hydroxylase
MAEDRFGERLQSAFGSWLGELRTVTRRQTFPLRLVRAERMEGPRTLLIGNALHQLHPVAGQGFNLGLRDLALLAERIQIQLNWGADIGAPEFLEAYARTRQQDMKRVVGFTDGLVKLFSNVLPPVALARTLGLLALDHCPAAKHLLARHAMGLSERLPRFS